MSAFRFLSFSKVCWEMRFLKNWPFSTDAFWMAPLFNIVSTSLSPARVPVLTFLDDVELFPEMFPKWSLFLDQPPVLKFRGCLLIFLSFLQNIVAFLLEGNFWLLHLEISFELLGIYPLNGVMELFLVNFYLKSIMYNRRDI